MALIGYARVSTTEQHLHLQQDALSAAGCLKIFIDIISGSKAARKGLAEALAYIREGTLIGLNIETRIPLLWPGRASMNRAWPDPRERWLAWLARRCYGSAAHDSSQANPLERA